MRGTHALCTPGFRNALLNEALALPTALVRLSHAEVEMDLQHSSENH